jgi:hypothetical protein
VSRILLPTGSGRAGDSFTDDFNEIEVYDDEDTRKAKLEQWIAKKLGTGLIAAYNNRQWKVMVDIENQMVIICCDSISNYKGYHIHMAGRTIHQLEEVAVKAGGEILERHNLARSKKFDPDIIETLARDSMDNVVTADSAAEPINA